MISCILVTPQTLVSYGIMAVLDAVPDMGIAGVVKTLAELQNHRGTCDVIILDPRSLDPSRDQTLQFLERVKGELPRILTIRDIDDTAPGSRVSLPYASGCFSLRDSAEVIVTAIRVAYEGTPGLCPCITGETEEHPVQCETRPLHTLLSHREREVFLLISQDLSMQAVAQRLNVSLSSANVYRSRVLRKMCMTSNLALKRYALQYQLLN